MPPVLQTERIAHLSYGRTLLRCGILFLAFACGSFASITLRTRVCLSPDFRHARRLSDSSRCARRRREQVQQVVAYSITSSARASRVGGTVRPSALAVLRLITSSYLVGACTGRSAGFSPLRMRST